MFTIMWTFGFIINGAPQIERMPDADGPMDMAKCEVVIAERVERLSDWARGRLGAPLDFPVGVRGECIPVQKDA